MIRDKVLVTVLMPVYNGEKYLQEAIDSILNQSYSYFEFLIINDGSTDQTDSIILDYSDDRIRYLKNESNIGLIATLNLGFSLSKGKYVARMDADDISLTHRIETQVAYLENNPKVGLLGSGYTIFGDNDVTINYPEDNESLKLAALFYNPFCHPSVLIRKQVLETAGLSFDEKYIHAEDYKFWTQFLSVTTCVNLKENLLLYRSHSNQVSQVHEDEQIRNSKLIQFEYLINAGFNLTKEEVEFLSKKTSSDIIEITSKFNSIEKLVFQNSRILFFDSKKTTNYFSQELKNLILESKVINNEMYAYYKASSLSKTINWTIKQSASIFLKRLKSKIK